ncbi:MAG: arsenate reductase (glutaredoxin) [Bacteroidota bacterium]
MSQIIIYHNGRCTKSRGALEILQENGLVPNIRYYLMEPLTQKELQALLKKLKMKASDLVRTSEPLYKEEYKDLQLTEKQWLKILTENPVLIERPIVENGDKAVVARPSERIFEIL